MTIASIFRAWEPGGDAWMTDVNRYCTLLEHAVSTVTGEFKESPSRMVMF